LVKSTPKLTKVRVAYGVSEYRLKNGLRVLFKQVKAAPVVAVCITFHVGSRNEAPGHTGSTHILEHLLFKDSKKFNQKNGKAITDYLEWFGAYINATTWLDRTNYFELLPREKLDEALALEADRLRNSLFTDKDLASEMTVVRNEYERSRNNPFELLDEEVVGTAYTVHPYRIPTIGTKEDIENSTAKKLREFYDTFYWPNNATLTVMGDVSWAEAQKLIEKYFAPIPASPHPIPEMSAIEPEQESPRSCEVKRPLGLSLAEIAYKIPAARHEDFPALLLISIILAGGFSSRLQKRLVDIGLAADVSSIAMPLHDPGLLTISVHCSAQIQPAAALDIVRKEIAALAKSNVTTPELKRAKERVLSMFSMERDGVFNEIRAVSEAIAAGDWALGYAIEEKIKKVTPTQIKEAAKKYLSRQKETTGILIDQTI
jgi:zinc protease